MSTEVRPQDLADEAVALVRRWLAEAKRYPVDPAAARLAGVLQDPRGLEFTVRFVDEVVRPEDHRAAAKKLRELSDITPQFLGWLRSLVSLGGTASRVAPGVVVPIARKALRQMVSHLIIDATDAKLGRAIEKLTADGVRLNLNLLGEYILGEKEAERRLAGTHRLLDRDDVDYVSIKVSSTVAPHNHWAFQEAVDHMEERLVPLFAVARAASPRKFINLDMEEYPDLDLTVAVFKRILDRPEFRDLEAGIVLQAYLPDALGVMMDLQAWAADRVAQGGAPIKVRVVKGANLPMEIVEARIHGWPLATWDSKQGADTSYKAVLDYALAPERVKNVRIGVAGHNLFDLALAWLLAKARGVEAAMDIEMLLGMATGQAEAVKKDVGSLLLYTPVVHPDEFDVAIAYLIRRLEEGASHENFMSAVFDLADDESLFQREQERFLASLAQLETITGDGDPENYRVPPPSRQQDRRRGAASGVQVRAEEIAAAGFSNRPNTDPNLAGNREWGREIAGRMIDSRLGNDLVQSHTLTDASALSDVLDRGRRAATEWRALPLSERARLIHRAGELLEQRRGDLLEVMGAECGKTLDQSDPEVSEAIDFAHYYASLATEMTAIDGADFSPRSLTAVIPPWNFPAAIPAGGVLAALAAGSAVIFKPAPAAARTGAVIAEALWEAGIPQDVLQYIQFPSEEAASALITDRRVDQVILTGAYDTAALFRSMRPDLPIFAETSGKNAIIVTPNADLDLAARDVAASAFGHAGQKCSAASLVILVGSVARSERFRSQLLDAVSSLKVGTPEDLTTQMGPVIAPPSGKLLRGLTTLGAGESWLIEPRPLDSDHPLARDAAGGVKLWTPGVRGGVQPGSEYHHVEYFGPILGIMTADTLTEAIEYVNAVDYGLTSGIHSLDTEEVSEWLESVHAGNLYVNRGITGAIVRRQSFGGWKKSAIGPGTKAGGPSYLYGLGTFTDAAPTDTGGTPLRPHAAALLTAAEKTGIAGAGLDWLRAAVGTDGQAWEVEFGIARDASGLEVERNLLRYRPADVTIRLCESAPAHESIRVLAAALAAEARPAVSTPRALPRPVAAVLDRAGIAVRYDDDAGWQEHLAELAARTGPDSAHRVRVVAGEDRAAREAEVYSATDGKPDIAVYAAPVVSAGRVEMLPYLREQAVSLTSHRFGTANKLAWEVI